MKRFISSLALCLFAPFALLSTAAAQGYPTRAVTLVVPYAAGTGIDKVARALANNLSKELGQAVIVDNRPGAATNIGVGQVARSKPDGYTLVIGASTAALAANKILYRNLGFDPQVDLTPVALVGKGTLVVLTTPASGVRSVEQMVRLAKADPTKVNFGVATTGARIWAELIKSALGIEAQIVPYASAGTMLTDLVGGQINFTVENTGTSRALVTSGKLIPIALASRTRGKFNANVPTLAELGVTDEELGLWWAVYAPRGTPKDIVARLNREINALLTNPEYMKARDFVEYIGGGESPEEIGAMQAVEVEKWRDLVKRTGVAIE